MSIADNLRGVYAKSPRGVRASLSPLLSLLPVSLKYGSTYRQLTADIRRSETDADFVDEYRSRALTQLVHACWRANTHYRQQFQRTFGSKFDPATFSLDNLGELPILNKEEVRLDADKFLLDNRADVDVASTSGTSGVPLKFYLDKNRSVKEWAFVHHIWRRLAYRPGMRIAVLRGVSIDNVDKRPWEFDRALSELRLSPFHLTPPVMDEYLQLIKDYKVRFIWGYPSAIHILAKHALRTGWRTPANLMGIFAISETLYPHQKEIIHQAFVNIKVLTSYGLSEKSAIAGELPTESGTYEFEPLYGITELVDDLGAPISEPGQAGRLIGTGFISTAMPLLRYDTGDVAEFVRAAATENCYRLRLRRIRSRWAQEFIVGSGGALISIAAINIHSPVYAKVRSFQYFQDTPGFVKVRVVPVDGYGEEHIAPFVEEIQQKVGEGVKFSLELVSELNRNLRGKQRFIDQRLDISGS